MYTERSLYVKRTTIWGKAMYLTYYASAIHLTHRTVQDWRRLQSRATARGRAMPQTLAQEVGAALRRAREARRLTLRDVAHLSSAEFKPSSLASYERGERAISIERFFRLMALYDIPPARLVAEVSRRVEGRPSARIDIQRVGTIGGEEAAILEGFIRNVLLLRRQPLADTISLRNGDIEVLATASRRRLSEFVDAIEPALHGSVNAGSSDPA